MEPTKRPLLLAAAGDKVQKPQQQSTCIRRTKSLHYNNHQHQKNNYSSATGSQIPVANSGGLKYAKSQRYANRRHNSTNDYNPQQQNGFMVNGLKNSSSGVSLPANQQRHRHRRDEPRGSFSSSSIASTGSSFNDSTFFEPNLYHQMSALSLISNGNGGGDLLPSPLPMTSAVDDRPNDFVFDDNDDDDDADAPEDFPFNVSLYTKMSQSWTGSSENKRQNRKQQTANGTSWPYRFYIIKQPNYPPLYLENSANHKRIYRTLVLGYPSSGKTSLIKQFRTLLAQHGPEVASFNPADPDQLNRKENLFLHFLEIDSFDRYLLQTPVVDYQPDVYLILFSVNIRDSFISVRKTLIDLQRWDDLENKTIIIVANKCDLARSRCVTRKEARELASSHNCKYIEISCTISHNIDALLQGIGSQICLKEQQQQQQQQVPASATEVPVSAAGTGTKLKRKSSFFKRILRKTAINKSKSCDDLHVL